MYLLIFEIFLFRTDFFRIMKTKADKMGFTPGTALNLLVTVSKHSVLLIMVERRERVKEKFIITPLV